jgi:hypothetical protein
MKLTVSAIVACCLASTPVLAASAKGAQPQEEGLSFLHAKVRVGNKLCMADHEHSGSSAGQPTQKHALSAAIASWASFTAWEYSPKWGSFKLAEGKKVSCSQSGGGWGCQIAARPCRPWR